MSARIGFFAPLFASRRAAALAILAVAGWSTAIGGCGPRLSPSDLGTVFHEIPKVPGADKPYPLPQLDKPPAAADDSTEKAALDITPDAHQADPESSAPESGKPAPE